MHKVIIKVIEEANSREKNEHKNGNHCNSHTGWFHPQALVRHLSHNQTCLSETKGELQSTKVSWGRWSAQRLREKRVGVRGSLEGKWLLSCVEESSYEDSEGLALWFLLFQIHRDSCSTHSLVNCQLKQKHSDSLSEGVIHLIKSKTFCSKKAFLGNKSNSEVRSSVEVVKTRTLWKRSLSHAPFGGHHLRVQISCVVNVFYGQGRCHVVHWSYIAESTNSENLFKYLLCAEHFLWHLGSKCLQYPRESELKHSRKCSRDKTWRSAVGSVGASSPPPEQDGAVVAHSELSL